MSAVRGKNLTEWVAAAQKLVLNSANSVSCPDCGEASLQVRDVEYGWGHNKGLERYLVCSNCGAFNHLPLDRSSESGSSSRGAWQCGQRSVPLIISSPWGPGMRREVCDGR
jgi:hypothetical protein